MSLGQACGRCVVSARLGAISRSFGRERVSRESRRESRRAADPKSFLLLAAAEACTDCRDSEDAASLASPRMPRPPHPLAGRTFYVLAWLLLSPLLFAARNGITWNFLNVPDAGYAGQTLSFSATVTNTGDNLWQADHYLEIRDQNGVHLSYVGLTGTAVNATRVALFTLTLPFTPGSSTYYFSAVENNREYFGATLARTIAVRPPPLGVTLDVAKTRLLVGERTLARSSAGSNGEVVAHGIEGRAVGGQWETWAEWPEDDGGETQVADASPPGPGLYEVRAYAARETDADFTYSNRVALLVSDVAPEIGTPPFGVIATVGETVTLTVAASGSALSYQWRKDDAALPGATGASLVLAAAQVTQSGNYSVMIANTAGTVASRPAAVVVNPHPVPLSVQVSHFPGGGGRRNAALSAAVVGDVITVNTTANLTAGLGWRHNVLVRRPPITTAVALAPEDGSGFSGADAAWNKDGWGSPHADGNSYDARVTGQPAPDLGNREPFIHVLEVGQTTSTRTLDLVLDAPGEWLVRTEVLDALGRLVGASGTVTVAVAAPALPADAAGFTYPYGRPDRFVGVFWNAGQAHRLWSTWRAEHDSAYRATWAVNWKLMWQPSPYFRVGDGSFLRLNPPADSPWQPFWAGHQVYPLIPDAGLGSRLTHDLTSAAFAEKAALRLMDIGVDFVAVDYTNQFLEEREDVFAAVNNLALACQTVAPLGPSGQRVRLTAVVPANINSGDWAGNGGFTATAIARFNAKLTTLYNRFARYEAAWFYHEDDNGIRKPLLLLWIGAGGENGPDGTLPAASLAPLKLADGRPLTEVFTIRWVGAFLPQNRRFLTGGNYTVNGLTGPVTGKYAAAKIWSYNETFPSAATVLPGATDAGSGVEAVTVQPLAEGEDRFGRVWEQNWPAGQGFHYETPETSERIPLDNYGQTWRAALAAARALNPRFLLTTWAEFGSENDEPRPELSVTIMDNNKFGTHFGDAFKDAVRLFKYRAPTAWLDTYAVGEVVQWVTDTASVVPPAFRPEQKLRLQGWVAPNVATTFAGGSVKVFVDDQLRGTAVVGGGWNGSTRWVFDLPLATLSLGRHTLKVLAEDGVGGASLAGVQFRGEPPGTVFPIIVSP
jgi:hypothetical protein